MPNDNFLNLIRYPILANDREKLFDSFQRSGIDLGLWFTAPISSPSINQGLFGYSFGACPNAEDVCTKICNLPTHLKMKTKDAKKIIELCR